MAFDEPEKGLDVRNVEYVRDRIYRFAMNRPKQTFVITHHPAFLDVEDGILINFFDPAGAKSVPIKDFRLKDYVSPPKITFEPRRQEPDQTRITSVTIKPDFHDYTFVLPGEEHYSAAYEAFQPYSQGLDGYAVSGLPAGTTLNTNAQFVILFGQNGSGKSSLFHKLEAKYVFGKNVETGDYVDISFRGQDPKIWLFRTDDQPTYGEEETYSSGQYQWSQLLEMFENDEPINPDTVLFLDEPEQRLDITKLPRAVESIYEYATKHNIQVFIATQRPEFLTLDGIVLDFFTAEGETVKSVSMSDFRLDDKLDEVKRAFVRWINTDELY